MSEPPPLPVQPLSYSDPAAGSASIILNAVALTGIVWGALQLAYSAGRTVPALWPQRTGGVSFGIALNFSRPLSVLHFALEMISDAAAIVLIVAAASLRSSRQWAVPTLMVALVIEAAVYFIQWCIGMIGIFSDGNFARWTAWVWASYLFMTASSMARYLILPLLLLWLITRPAVRRYHNSIASTM